MRKKAVNLNIIPAINIGHFAHRLLSGRLTCTVWGNTSKGIFLKIQPEGLIFLSYEKFMGPFTINIQPSLADNLRDVIPGTNIYYEPEEMLHFEQQNLAISLKKTTIWQPGLFEGTAKEKEMPGNLLTLSGWLRSYTPPGSFGSISSAFGSRETTRQNGTAGLYDKIHGIYQSIKTLDKPRFIKSASTLIGFGSGLTPSGDDFLTGMSLAVTRYNNDVNDLKEYASWFELLYPLMNAKTTILSSALFSASLQGSADERLIQTFDSIVRGNMVEEVIIPSISSWGSSSGFDALAGFYILMKAIFS